MEWQSGRRGNRERPKQRWIDQVISWVMSVQEWKKQQEIEKASLNWHKVRVVTIIYNNLI